MQFINNSADQGGAIVSDDNVNIADNAQVVFQANHAETLGGAIAGSVQFINNSANDGSEVPLSQTKLSPWQPTRQKWILKDCAMEAGGAIASGEHVTIAGSVQFTYNRASQGGAIASVGSAS